MAYGRAPIADESTVEAMLERRSPHRRRIGTGAMAMITVAFWALWIYLALPVLALMLWVLGVRRFVTEMLVSGYEDLAQALLAYSSVLLVLVSLLLLWILWNVVRHGGGSDRRTRDLPDLPDLEVLEAFRLDGTVLEELRTSRVLRIELDKDGCVVVLGSRLTTPVPPA